MNVTIVHKPEVRAVVLRTNQNGRDVRQAWKEIQELLSERQAELDGEHGYVFVPEWQWATGVHTLWVGTQIGSFEELPEGIETLTLPAKKYAKITVRGDRGEMDAVYRHLDEWFKNGEHERDMAEGSYSFEANRLHPVNPFLIPADVIDFFDFDIYAPIKAVLK
ncbi:GyrI-like domain-containing protein [Paenibacillus sp. MBLB4367]|uniref:GyrI-like domain-containing protein n=1 Tax=Paenibacillus sp. MBLB4367 TaxID=3384767 RepID=UPI0039082BC3